MQNSEWPDAEKLKELRQAGIFPLSRLSVRAVTSAAVLLLTFLFLSEFEQLKTLIVSTMSQPMTNFAAVQAGYYKIFDKVKLILLTYLAVYLVVGLLVVLFQSRFYFSLVNFAFNLSQVVRVQKASLSYFLVAAVRGVFGLSVGLLVSSALFYMVSKEVVSIIFSDKFYAREALRIELLTPVLKSVLVFSLIVLVVLAVLSYSAVRAGFMLRHRTADRFSQRH